MPRINQKAHRILLSISILLIIGTGFVFVISFSSNIPWYDDFNQQFGTIERFIRQASILDALFYQHNEHKLLTTYIFPLSTYLVFGFIDMRASVFASFLCIIAIFLLLNSLKAKPGIDTTSLAVALLLFLPAGPSLVWAGGSLQYSAVALFGLLTLYFLKFHVRLALSAACIAFFLSSFSMISGLITSIPAILYVLISRKNKWKILIFCACSVAVWYGYMYNFQFVNAHPSPFVAIETPLFAIGYYFALTSNILGGLVPLPAIIAISIIAHVVLISLFVIHRQKLDFTDPLWFMWLYIVLISGIIMAGRVGFLSLEQALADRYNIFSALYWAIPFILLNNYGIFPKIWMKILIVGLLSLHFTTSFCLSSSMRTHKEKLNNALYSILADKNHSDQQYFGISGNRASQFIKKGISDGYYHLPPSIIERLARDSMPPEVNHSN